MGPKRGLWEAPDDFCLRLDDHSTVHFQFGSPIFDLSLHLEQQLGRRIIQQTMPVGDVDTHVQEFRESPWSSMAFSIDFASPCVRASFQASLHCS